MTSLLLKPQIPAFTVPQLSEAMDALEETAGELKVIILPLNSDILIIYVNIDQLISQVVVKLPLLFPRV